MDGFSFDVPNLARSDGAQNPQGAGSVSDATRAQAREDAERALSSSPRRRRRARSDGQSSGSDIDAAQAEVAAALRAQLEALHDPDAWGALLGLPADAALTLTGKARWKLEDRERKTLGTTGSAAARTMMITNPRALAFMMLGSALFAIYVPRAMAELKEIREAEAAKKASQEKKA